MRELLRAFRSPDLRDLTRLAIDQGWAVDLTGGNHVRVVNPANGQRVILSATAWPTPGPRSGGRAWT